MFERFDWLKFKQICMLFSKRIFTMLNKDIKIMYLDIMFTWLRYYVHIVKAHNSDVRLCFYYLIYVIFLLICYLLVPDSPNKDEVGKEIKAYAYILSALPPS